MNRFFSHTLIIFVSSLFLDADVVSEKKWFSETPQNHADLNAIQDRLRLILSETKKSLVAIESRVQCVLNPPKETLGKKWMENYYLQAFLLSRWWTG